MKKPERPDWWPKNPCMMTEDAWLIWEKADEAIWEAWQKSQTNEPPANNFMTQDAAMGHRAHEKKE